MLGLPGRQSPQWQPQRFLGTNSGFMLKCVPSDRAQCFELAAQFIRDGHDDRTLRLKLSTRPRLERFLSSGMVHHLKAAAAVDPCCVMLVSTGVCTVPWDS